MLSPLPKKTRDVGSDTLLPLAARQAIPSLTSPSIPYFGKRAYLFWSSQDSQLGVRSTWVQRYRAGDFANGGENMPEWVVTSVLASFHYLILGAYSRPCQ